MGDPFYDAYVQSQKRIREDDPYISGGNILAQPIAKDASKGLGSNLAASAIQGFMSGLMSGYGDRRSTRVLGQEMNDPASRYTMDLNEGLSAEGRQRDIGIQNSFASAFAGAKGSAAAAPPPDPTEFKSGGMIVTRERDANGNWVDVPGIDPSPIRDESGGAWRFKVLETVEGTQLLATNQATGQVKEVLKGKGLGAAQLQEGVRQFNVEQELEGNKLNLEERKVDQGAEQFGITQKFKEKELTHKQKMDMLTLGHARKKFAQTVKEYNGDHKLATEAAQQAVFEHAQNYRLALSREDTAQLALIQKQTMETAQLNFQQTKWDQQKHLEQQKIDLDGAKNKTETQRLYAERSFIGYTRHEDSWVADKQLGELKETFTATEAAMNSLDQMAKVSTGTILGEEATWLSMNGAQLVQDLRELTGSGANFTVNEEKLLKSMMSKTANDDPVGWLFATLKGSDQNKVLGMLSHMLQLRMDVKLLSAGYIRKGKTREYYGPRLTEKYGEIMGKVPTQAQVDAEYARRKAEKKG